ncbi:MAG: Caffeyl-CoA reductase-Etf complex subunit CarC [Acidimicrobiales bacterium]|nr:MAG: acyl-CoA dehydrogenase [Actinomycetota bacterium]MBV6508175.1 Caffeyl-CoA reductase-Etf complex subunit CarC [Acidimicrobiales bacterium]RIK08169.1 MAG: acyl-CoA dehydrogenase [Acidobacteriota bacterium]
MQFSFTEDQVLFQRTVRDLLAKECPPEVVRAAWEGEPAHAGRAWGRLAEVGVTGMLVPEEHGGMGLDETDLVLALEESGRVALPDPIVSTALVAAPLLRDRAPQAIASKWLPRIATGDALVVVGLDESPNVPSADVADLLIMQLGSEFHLVDPTKVTLNRHSSVDGSRHLFTVDWRATDESMLVGGEQGWQSVNEAFDRLLLGVSAQLVGLAAHMLDTTVTYVKDRHQFGVPIGSFQAIKHQLADCLIKLEFARPLVYRAAYSIATTNPDASSHVSMAKAFASDAATFVAGRALQCHGAIGYTDEYDLHMWMKRAWALASRYGDSRFHRRRVGRAIFGPDPQTQ